MTSSSRNNSHILDTSLSAAASISDVAKMVGLSRARFYQLVKEKIFPPPIYDISTRRPYYTCEQIKTILHIRKTNKGHNGQTILFYSRRKNPFNNPKPTPFNRQNKSKQTQPSHWSGIIEGLKALGLDGVKSSEVEEIIRSNYPSGADGIDNGELLRTCFRALRRQNMSQNTGNNVGR